MIFFSGSIRLLAGSNRLVLGHQRNRHPLCRLRISQVTTGRISGSHCFPRKAFIQVSNHCIFQNSGDLNTDKYRIYTVESYRLTDWFRFCTVKPVIIRNHLKSKQKNLVFPCTVLVMCLLGRGLYLFVLFKNHASNYHNQSTHLNCLYSTY